MEEQNEGKILPKAPVVKNLEAEIDQLIFELDSELIPVLTHGEAKRLLKAVLKYPKEDADFSNDRIELRRAYSASKRLQDNLIGLATEVVIERMIKASQEEETSPERPKITEDFLDPNNTEYVGGSNDDT